MTIGQLSADPRFAHGDARRENAAACRALVEAWTVEHTAAEVTELVGKAIPIEPSWIDYNGHLNMAYYNVLFDR